MWDSSLPNLAGPPPTIFVCVTFENPHPSSTVNNLGFPLTSGGRVIGAIGSGVAGKGISTSSGQQTLLNGKMNHQRKLFQLNNNTYKWIHIVAYAIRILNILQVDGIILSFNEYF